MKNYFGNLQFDPVYLIILSLICFIIVIVFIIIWHKKNTSTELNGLYLKIKEDIKSAVTPKFIEMSSEVKDLVYLAVEIWRMEQRIVKSASSFPENQLKGLNSSVQKLKQYLEKNDIEIRDYTNQKFNEGLNLDVLSVEKDSKITEPVIKETVEPTIMHKGQVVKKAKVIVLKN